MKPRTKSRITDPEAQACKAAPADQSAPPSLAGAPSLEELKRAEVRLERLLAREQDARLQAEVMRDANLALTKELGLERVLETLLTCLRQLVPYDTANVMLCDEASQVTVTAMRGYENFLVDPAVVKANSLDANKNALLRTIFSTGQSVLVPDTEKETAWQRVPGSEHVRNWIGVPLVANGKVFGVYSLNKNQPNFFSAEHVRKAEMLASQAATAIQNAQLFRQVKKDAAELERRIGERKRAEEALRQAEQKYRDIFENVGEGIFQTTPDGKFITANPAIAHMLGFDSAEELINNRIDIAHEHYVNPRDRDEFKCLLEAQGQVRDFEHEAFQKDGKRIWISENVRAVRDNKGAALYYEGTSRDITERRRAEARSAAFANLARTLSGARTPLDAGRIIAQTAKQLFGWDACNLDLYDADRDLVYPMLNVDTIGGAPVDVTPLISASKPTARGRRVIDCGPELILREEPIKFDPDAIPFGNQNLPSASLMSVPIQHGAKVVGLLSIQSYMLRAYDSAGLNDLAALADHCGEALNRIQAEELLRESEERYRDLVENSHELICTHDLDGKILSANRVAAQLLGYDLKAFVGKANIRDILAPEFRDQFAEYMARLQKNGATSGLMVVQTSSGERRVWEYYNSLRTEGLTEPIVRGVARDITEQRQAAQALSESEQRYRELFENSRDAIYVHDLSGRYVSVNRAAETLSGYSRDEIIGRHYSNFIDPRHLKDARENFCRKLDVPIETTYEAEVVCKNGARTPVQVSSRMIYKDGEVIGVQGTVRDISERKRAQEVLQTYSRRLITAQEAERQNIARELHDEIGQVLTAVSLNLHSIKKTIPTEAFQPNIEESLQIVEDALSRVRELSLELRPSLLDDLGLAAALRWYVARYTARSGIPTEIIGDAEVGRISHEVETACFRITQEALTNTARHSQATRASVQLERTNGNLHLTVTDNGIGFEPDRLLYGMASALALGLRGMQERALAVKGDVQVTSRPGHGTQITLNVPVKQ